MIDDIPLINISIQPIELCKLLKIANMVGGGGEAKIVISEGYVAVNNEVEFQKRKKIYHEDIIEFNGEIFQVNFVEDLTKPEPSIQPLVSKVKATKKKQTKKKAKQNAVEKEQTTEMPARSKRKPISF